MLVDDTGNPISGLKLMSAVFEIFPPPVMDNRKKPKDDTEDCYLAKCVDYFDGTDEDDTLWDM